MYLKIGYVAIHSIHKARCGLGPECGSVTTSFKSPLKNILMYKNWHTSASVQFPFINSKSTWRHVYMAQPPTPLSPGQKKSHTLIFH